ncbi:MAG: hypothetical protein MK172_12980 [Verrucomicrobiales bacterium]|nr:hypothetical protein [Verrucomicrobiales bacterium]
MSSGLKIKERPLRCLVCVRLRLIGPRFKVPVKSIGKNIIRGTDRARNDIACNNIN